MLSTTNSLVIAFIVFTLATVSTGCDSTASSDNIVTIVTELVEDLPADPIVGVD